MSHYGIYNCCCKKNAIEKEWSFLMTGFLSHKGVVCPNNVWVFTSWRELPLREPAWRRQQELQLPWLVLA